MRLNIFMKNHAHLCGIEDYLRFLTALFERRGWQVSVSQHLSPDAMNLVIDEFTSALENARLRKFRSTHPDTPMVLLMTEFPARNLTVSSFNNFGGLRNAATIMFAEAVLPSLRGDFPQPSIWRQLRYWASVPLAAPYIASGFVRSKLSRMRSNFKGIAHGNAGKGAFSLPPDMHRAFYLHMRYMGLISHIDVFDGILTSHEHIQPAMQRDRRLAAYSSRVLGVVYPELEQDQVIDQLFSGTGPFVEVTGTITGYRRRVLSRLRRDITLMGLGNTIQQPRVVDFSNPKARAVRGAFSLHPPQSRRWPYSSPTRIYRALVVDHNIPVLTKKFSQNPLEDVCIHYQDRSSLVPMAEMLEDKCAATSFLAPRLATYASLVTPRNDNIVAALEGIGSKGAVH